MTHLQATLRKLADARLGYVREWAVKGQIRCPDGCLPLWSLQGPDCGGSAANMRLYELKAPEGVNPDTRGIPIKKIIFDYILEGRKHRLVCYQLDVEPALIESLIDFAECRLRPEALRASGLQIEEYDDHAGGVSCRAVRLVKAALHSPRTQPNLFVA